MGVMVMGDVGMVPFAKQTTEPKHTRWSAALHQWQ